jgi:hypothetical protein
MRKLLALFLSCMTVYSHANVSTGFKAAMQRGLVTVSASATGQVYYGKALRVHVVNTTKDRLQLSIDPALIFKPEDDSYQYLVLPAEETLTLAPGGNTDLDVQTFCGKLHARGPRAGLSYTFYKQGDSTLIKVTQHIRRNRLYDHLGQEAIWAITDNTDLEGIIDPERPKQSADLLALLVKLTGRPVPPYFRLYKLETEAGQPVFRKRVLKVIANLEWKLAAPANITLGVYNSAGTLIQSILDKEKMVKGGYKMMVQFEAENAPPGNYYLRLFNGSQLLQEKTITLD